VQSPRREKALHTDKAIALITQELPICVVSTTIRFVTVRILLIGYTVAIAKATDIAGSTTVTAGSFCCRSGGAGSRGDTPAASGESSEGGSGPGGEDDVWGGVSASNSRGSAPGGDQGGGAMKATASVVKAILLEEYAEELVGRKAGSDLGCLHII
jgi:hypothetical protein